MVSLGGKELAWPSDDDEVDTLRWRPFAVLL